MNAAALEAGCDISAGPVLPGVAANPPATAARVEPVNYFTKLKARVKAAAGAEPPFVETSAFVLNDKPAKKK